MNIDKYAVIERLQLEKLCATTQLPVIQSQDILTYSFKSRYELKKNDPSKCRFCPDPLISKEYERELLEKFNIY